MIKLPKRGLLVRVGADQSAGGGDWNAPTDGSDFAYVPIPEDSVTHPGMSKPYTLAAPAVARFGWALPAHLGARDMHLDPDFFHLTYGDQGQRAIQISSKLGTDDLLVFYAAFRHVVPQPRLVYALIGLYVIEEIVPAVPIPSSRRDENAHTRRKLPSTAADIVIRAKPDVSGRFDRCISVGSFRSSVHKPLGRPCYRVESNILSAWGGLSSSDGYVQRSARLPEFLNVAQFYRWFLGHGILLVRRNN